MNKDSHISVNRFLHKTVNYDSYEAIILSALFWGSSYGLLRIFVSNRSAEYSCRIVTFLHGLFMSIVGLRECFLPGTPFTHPEWPTNDGHRFLFVSSLGYFIFDLMWCIIYGTETKLMMAHHVYSVCALYRMLVRNSCGPQAVCALGSMEVTNPFLQARWFIRTEGMYPSKLFTAVEISFVITFIIVRIFIGSYFMTLVFYQPKNDMEFLILAVAIYIMSWMFLINMLKYLKDKYRVVNKKD